MGKLSATNNLKATPSQARELALLIAVARVDLDPVEQNRISDLVAESLDWDLLLVLAERHNLEPLLFTHLHRYGAGLVPPEILQSLREECKSIARRSWILATRLQGISAHLQAQGIKHISYKGPLFAELYYGSCALRVSNDLDLIVRPSDLARVRKALGEIGFSDQNGLTSEQQAVSFRFGFEHPFHDATGVELDLHWRVVQKFKSRSLDMEGIWQRLRLARLFDSNVPTFCPEDMLIALCLHAGHHGWMQLSYFCDIAQLLRTHPTLDWNIVCSHLRDSNTRRLVYVCWRLLNRHWHAEIPEEMMARASADAHVSRLAHRVETEIWPSPVPELTTANLRWLLERSAGEDVLDRLSLLLGSIFQPAVEDFAAFRLPWILAPLYPLLRAFRLACKGAASLWKAEYSS
jgi:hypothetical protein